MEKIIRGSFSIDCAFNGKNYYGDIIIDSGSDFFQFYDKDADKCIPDWSNGGGPKFHFGVKDSANADKIPQADSVKLMWNDTEIKFDSNGLSTAQGGATSGPMSAGCFKRTVEDGIVKFQVMKNLFSSANTDSDKFYMKGDIATSSGSTMTVRSDTRTAQCVNMSLGGGNTYYVVVDSTDIEDGKDEGTLTPKVYSSQSGGTDISQQSGITFAWYDAADPSKPISSNRVLTVNKDSVNGVECYFVKVTIDGKAYYGYGTIKDKNDPFTIILYATGLASGGGSQMTINEGETLILTAKMADSNGEELPDTEQAKYALSFYLRNSSTNEPIKNGTKDYFDNPLTLTYAQINGMGGHISGSAHCELKK